MGWIGREFLSPQQQDYGRNEKNKEKDLKRKEARSRAEGGGKEAKASRVEDGKKSSRKNNE